MTREQAQVYAKLSREDIEKINEGYAKHYEVLCAYASGSEIQMKENDGKWVDRDNPHFCYSCDYRVKPIVETAEPWKPKIGEEFFYVAGFGVEKSREWEGDRSDILFYDFGNCFKTREQAEAARERVRAALKGNY